VHGHGAKGLVVADQILCGGIAEAVAVFIGF
jgi:hypothetical protein